MYNLGEHFRLDVSKGEANEKSVIKGNKYRITILTERLVRLEYSESGIFNDKPTALVSNRNFEVPEYNLQETPTSLVITTKYFKLTYLKDKPFEGTKVSATNNLKIDLVNTERTWYYKHPEVRNYQTPGLSSDMNGGKNGFTKGLYSADGFSSIYDTTKIKLNDYGNMEFREDDYSDAYVFMYLKDFALCLQDYFKLTGSPALIPRYALGNWWSRNLDYNSDSLNELVTNFEENDIPLSVLVLNDKWHLENKNTDSGFTWDTEKYPNPAELIKSFHEKGIRVGVEVNPMDGIKENEANFAKLADYLMKDETGNIPFNILDPKYIDVYLKLLIHPIDNSGVDFYSINYQNKNDLNGLWALNHYHFYDMTRDFKRRPLILSRNSLINPHKYPVLYSGKSVVSWETLQDVPFYNIKAANNGVSFYAHDIGGYHKGTEDNELYTRFVQLGCFSPIMKFGSEKGKYYKREPWRWSYKTNQIVKHYLNLRNKLIPYLYAESYKYSTYGMPLIIPVFYNHPEMYDDVRYRTEYYLGTELFISPITNRKDYVMNRAIHKFFIPKGTWYDFITGKKFPGDREYISFFKDNEYPVFAKAGAIIPLGRNEHINDTTPPKDMEIHVFPGANNQYSLYEDDGVSDLYKRGYYLLSSIEYNYLPNNYTMIVRAIDGKDGIVPPKRNYKFYFRNTKEASDVVVRFNNDVIKYEKYVDGADFIVEVKDVPTIGQLTVNCKGKDIEIDAVRLINDDIETIISDLELETTMKEELDEVLFSDLTIKKKRIAVRKLKRKGLEPKFIKLFLKLLEYVEQV